MDNTSLDKSLVPFLYEIEILLPVHSDRDKSVLSVFEDSTENVRIISKTYIYIYACVCVCVCVWFENQKSNSKKF